MTEGLRGYPGFRGEPALGAGGPVGPRGVGGAAAGRPRGRLPPRLVQQDEPRGGQPRSRAVRIVGGLLFPRHRWGTRFQGEGEPPQRGGGTPQGCPLPGAVIKPVCLVGIGSRQGRGLSPTRAHLFYLSLIFYIYLIPIVSRFWAWFRSRFWDWSTAVNGVFQSQPSVRPFVIHRPANGVRRQSR